MFMKKALLLTVALFGINFSARADILAAGAAYGGPSQTVAACYVYNAGAGPVSIVSRSIFREPNVAQALFFNSCGAALAAGSSCGIAANIVNNAAHSCRFVVSPSGADMRGSFELRDGTTRVLNNVEMR